MFTDGTDEIGGKLLAFIDVTADAAAPQGLARGSRHFLRFRFDMGMVVVVSGGRDTVQHIHVRHFADEQGMGAQVHCLHHFRGDEGVGPFRDVGDAVLRPLEVGVAGEFVHVPAALEAEMLEDVKVRLLAEGGHVEVAGLQNHVVGVVHLVHGDADLVGLGCHLHGGVDDTAAVVAAFRGGEDEQAVRDFVHCFFVHKQASCRFV